jgi:hypothetical protein
MVEGDEHLLFGKPYRYWVELQAQTPPDISKLILEIADLRAKVSFYESRIDEMNKFMEYINKRGK